MGIRITFKKALQRVRQAGCLNDIKSLFKDIFGLTEVQLLGGQHIPGLPEAEAPIELAEAAKMANPDYDKGGGYHENCQRCVPVYVLLRRGYKVKAKANPYQKRNGTSKRRLMNGSECFVGATIHGYGNDNAWPLDKTGLLRELNLLPNGAMASIFWVRPNSKFGHVIVCEKLDGNLVFVDPQTGNIGYHVLGEAAPQTGYFWYRIDGLKLSEGFEWNEILTPLK